LIDFVKEFKVPIHSAAANIQWRINLREKANKDVGLQRAIKYACAHDICYFCCAWGFIFEPRKRRTLPFILWPHQADGFRKVEASLGTKNIIVVKSRDEGWSWALDYFAMRDWMFKEMAKIGLVSSTLEKVDNPGNLGSLFGKIDWALTKFPKWMVGLQSDQSKKRDWTRSNPNHSYNHHWTGSQINGFAGTPEAPRGDRYFWFGVDEHASDDWKKDNNDRRLMDATGATTESRWFVSTPNGPSGQFYEIVTEPSNAEKLFITWRDNPTKNRGMYRMVQGKPEALDPVNNPLPPDYQNLTESVLTLLSQLRKRGFNLDQGTRSTWYDQKCLEPGATPMSMAKEYDLSFGGSVEQVFHDEFMKRVKATAEEPRVRGTFTIVDRDKPDGMFEINPTGQVHLWCPLDERNRPPRARYALAADVASGNGGKYTSNSVIQVINLETKEQVLEFATNILKPEQLADVAMALGYWFHTAYLSWETNNHGGAFGDRVIEKQYPDCFMRKEYNKKTKQTRRTFGFHTSKETKEIMFTRMRVNVAEGDLIVRSKPLSEEFTQYVRDDQQRIDFAGEFMNPAHGDRVMAMGVAVMAMEDRPTPKREAGTYDPEHPPVGTMAYREMMYRDEDARDEDPWGETDPAEMIGMGR
jgi:hypothetical protein